MQCDTLQLTRAPRLPWGRLWAAEPVRKPKGAASRPGYPAPPPRDLCLYLVLLERDLINVYVHVYMRMLVFECKRTACTAAVFLDSLSDVRLQVCNGLHGSV